MKRILITNANIVNEGKITRGDVYVKDGLIYIAGGNLKDYEADIIIEGEGKYLFPGLIDDQVHFREPGLTHKADIYTESKAAVAAGIPSLSARRKALSQRPTLQLLEDMHALAPQKSLANYSFFLGATNDNLDVLHNGDPDNVCGIKVFQGSATGHMLVDNA